MVFDIQVPIGNESKLIEESKRTGIKQIIFLYKFKTKKDLVKRKEANEGLSNKYKMPIHTGLLVRPEKTTDISRFSKSLYFEADFIAAESKDEKIIRSIVSQAKVDLIINYAYEALPLYLALPAS